MITSEIEPIIARLIGYWTTPELTPEESLAWTETLLGSLQITSEEAVHVLRAEAENGRQWRPRPGELVALVQELRRRRVMASPPQSAIEQTTERMTSADGFAAARAALEESDRRFSASRAARQQQMRDAEILKRGGEINA